MTIAYSTKHEESKIVNDILIIQTCSPIIAIFKPRNLKKKIENT